MTRHPLRTALLLLLAVIALNTAGSIVSLLGQLLPLLVLGAGGYLIWRAVRPRHVIGPRPAVLQGSVVPDRTADLEAENADGRARLAEAEESARAAWDAASSAQPRHGRPQSSARDRLLADRLGGVRDLWERP
jgi:hypothetical protein